MTYQIKQKNYRERLGIVPGHAKKPLSLKGLGVLRIIYITLAVYFVWALTVAALGALFVHAGIGAGLGLGVGAIVGYWPAARVASALWPRSASQRPRERDRAFRAPSDHRA